MTAISPLFVAVDLGAGSGRVMLVGFAPGELRLDEVRRFRYPVDRRDGHLRWDFGLILGEVRAGLAAAAAAARTLGRPVVSVGVDTWGVDYGLLDASGRLIEDPVCYRDERTEGMVAEATARVSRADLFARTGIQFLPFNTVYQLLAHARAGLPAAAHRLLLMPDLLHHALCGRAVVEYTNATTTQLVDARTRTWDRGLVQALGLPGALLPEIVPAGTLLGPLTPDLAATVVLEGTAVVAPATHDTGSAVAGTPIDPGWAYISSGTWSLVGIERTDVLIDDHVARHDFTNEGGAFGTIRFLKNVMGLWLLESCRREWQQAGLGADFATLLPAVAARADFPGLVFPDDPRLLNPASMVGALNRQLAESGQPTTEDPVTLTKIVLDSLALRYARVLGVIDDLTGTRAPGLRIVGGGSQNDYLNQATATASGRPVLAGPVEATAIGNALVQAIAAGRFSSLADARAHVRDRLPARRFDPRPSPGWEDARRRYDALEAQFAR